jgi:hypothetical protein
VSDVDVREGVAQGYVFLPCDSWAIAYDATESLAAQGIYPVRPRSSPGIIVREDQQAQAIYALAVARRA